MLEEVLSMRMTGPGADLRKATVSEGKERGLVVGSVG